MRAQEFLKESTQMSLADGSVVAVKSSLGVGKGSKVTMLVTKKVWDAIKDEQANTELMQYDIATAEMIIRDWQKKGAEVVWKTAADFNKDARDLENHRFRNDPEVASGFDDQISQAQDNAKTTTKASLKTVKTESETMPDVRTHSPKNIASKHGVPVKQILKQLRMGIKVEGEHTTDYEKAMEIALDHLSEIPDYYTKLAKMEKS